MIDIGENLGQATLELDTDLLPFDRGLAEAERRTVAWLAQMQALVDRGMGPISARLGSIGTSYDQQLTPPLARFGAATDAMAKKIDGSLAQIRLEQAATARELQRTAAVAQAASAAESGAAERSGRAYAAQAAAARLSADEQVAAAARVAAANAAAGGTGGSPTARPVPAGSMLGEQATAERLALRSGEPVWGVRGPKAAGSIGNPIVMVMEAANRTGLGSLAAAIGESSASGGARSAVVAEGGGGPSPTTIVATSGGSGGGGVPPVAIPVPSGGGSGGGGTFLGGLLGGAAAGGAGGGGGGLRKLLTGGGSAIPFLGATAAAGSLGAFAGLGPEHVLMTLLGIGGSAAGGIAGGGLLAAGAAGQIAVGGGSDIAVLKSTIADTKALGEGYKHVQEAVGKYGAESKQAALAQHELNMLMAELGNTAGVKAEVGLAKQAEALNMFWDKATSNARVQAVSLLSQFVTLAHDFVPKVAQAAEQNLAIINKGIKPLFGWLEGPEGMGIWNDLEKRFKQNLPTAVHAFSSAVELLLKTVDVASQYTGGFTSMLDRFFTKWNSPAFFAVWRDEISRLIGDFHLWETLIKLVGQDIYYLFVNDAQTGKGLIETINEMLLRLREWEKRTAGSQHNIFQLHKEEVIALLKALVGLVAPFSQLYLTLAPLAVPIVTDLAKAMTWLVKGLDELGPASAGLLGVSLVLMKLGLFLPAVRALTGAFGVSGGLAASLGLANKEGKLLSEATLPEVTAALSAETRMAAGAATVTGDFAASEVAAGAGAAGMARYAPFMVPGRGLTPVPGFGPRAGIPGLGPTGITAAEQEAALGAATVPAAAGGLSKASLIRGAAYGGLAGLATNTVLNIAGVKGSTNTILSMGAAGAAMGFEFGGPWGLAAGALAGGGIGAALTLLNHKAPDYGKKFAEGYVGPLAPLLTRRTAEEYRAQLDKQRNETKTAHNLSKTLRREEAEQLELRPDEKAQVHTEFASLKAKAFNQGFISELREGMTAAEQFKHALEGVQHHTTFAFTQNAVAQLHTLSGEAQNAVAKSMVDMAAKLEKEGHLPKGAMERVLNSLKAAFPPFKRYMEEHAESGAAQVAAALRLSQAQTNLKGALSNIRVQWELLSINPAATGQDLLKNAGRAAKELRTIIAREHGFAKTEALHDLHQLEGGTISALTAMKNSASTNMASFSAAIKAHIPGSVALAQTELSKFTAAVVGAMESGAVSSAEGAKIIGEELNVYLKALGAKLIPTVAVTAAGRVTAAVSKISSLSGLPASGGTLGKAGGGLVQIGHPGEAGYDSVPLNVGGTPIMVAPGEQVAVFNRHQLPIVDEALGPMGGLAGLFQQVDRPHYMAAGGIVPSMVGEANKISSQHDPYVWGGGHNASFAGPFDCSGAVSAVLHAAGLLSAPETSGELMNFGASGPGEVTIYANPVHTFMSLMGRFFGTHGSSGAGWYQGGPLPGYAVRHVPTSGAEGLGAIGTPGIKGTGAIAALARSGLGHVAAAANVYLQRHGFGASTPGASEANIGHLVPGIMSIERQAAQMAGIGWNPQIVAALLAHESGGGINEPPSGSLNATGPNQVIPSTFAAYAMSGHKQISNPLDNAIASFRYVKSRYHSLAGMASATGLLTGGYKGYARGGLFAPGGVVPTASPKPTKPKGVVHVKHAAKSKHFTLSKLITSMAKIPGFAGLDREIGPQEGSYNLLVDEANLLGGMTGNPASILDSDMSSLTPTLAPGEPIHPHMLVPQAERVQQRTLQQLGESPELNLQASLLQYIGGLDDHRLLSGVDIGVLAKDFHGTAAGQHFSGVGLTTGQGVFRAQQQVLEAQKHAQVVLAALMKQQIHRALAYIKSRKERKTKLEKLLAATFARYHKLQQQIKSLKTVGLRRRLTQAEMAHSKSVLTSDAQIQKAALAEAIATEKAMNPWEQNHAALRAWEAEDKHLAGYIAALKVPSTGAVTNAKEAIVRNELQNELTPLEEALRAMGGSSTSIGKGGDLGEVTKQISVTQGGQHELETKYKEAVQNTIPQLELTISGIASSLAESAEAVAPSLVQPEGTTTKPGETELTSLLKTQNEQLAQQLAVSQKQYKVLRRLPPFAGRFHEGGVVPGPSGAEMMALVQSGEVISQPGGGNYEAHVHVADGMSWLKDLIRVEVKQGTRESARSAGRPLPSRGGGLLV